MTIKPINMIALDLANRAFGGEHVRNAPLRALRCAEEAVELAQSLDVERELMHKLVDIVYSRPKGDTRQELGGVSFTAVVMAAGIFDCDLDVFFETELRRVLAKPIEHFSKRNQEKINMGLIV